MPAAGYPSPSEPFAAQPAPGPQQHAGSVVTPLPSRASVLPMVASVGPLSDPFGHRASSQRRPWMVAGIFVLGAILIGVVAFAISPRSGDESGHANATSGLTHPLPASSAATLGPSAQSTGFSAPLVFTANVNDLPRAPSPRRVIPWVAPRPPVVRPAAPAPQAQAAAPPAAQASATEDDSQDEPTPPTPTASAAPAPKAAAPAAEPAPAPVPAASSDEVAPPAAPPDPLLREMQKAVEDPSRNK